jgi:hypothetical protein
MPDCAAPVSPTNDRNPHRQAGCGCISKPAKQRRASRRRAADSTRRTSTWMHSMTCVVIPRAFRQIAPRAVGRRTRRAPRRASRTSCWGRSLTVGRGLGTPGKGRFDPSRSLSFALGTALPTPEPTCAMAAISVKSGGMLPFARIPSRNRLSIGSCPGGPRFFERTQCWHNRAPPSALARSHLFRRSSATSKTSPGAFARQHRSPQPRAAVRRGVVDS